MEISFKRLGFIKSVCYISQKQQNRGILFQHKILQHFYKLAEMVLALILSNIII